MRGRWLSGLFLVSLPLLPFLIKMATQASLQAPAVCSLEGAVAELGDVVQPPCEPNEAGQVQARARADEFRAELLIALDLFVRAQRSFQAESGAYTKALGRTPDVFGSLTHYYRIDVARATRGELLVVAAGEGRRTAVPDTALLAGDRAAIDERFTVRANFHMPAPPRGYLQTLARMTMNKISANRFRIPDERDLRLIEGVFSGYFRYEIKPVSDGGRTIVATGLAGPVKGDIVEMLPGASLYEWVYEHRHGTWLENEMYGNLEKIYLAEKIHQDHVGSYSPTFRGLVPVWNGLVALSVEQSPLMVQELQLDPTFGFHAEVARRPFLMGGERSPSSVRALSVNGYGQFSEASSIESIVNQFEQARQRVEKHGDFQSAGSPAKALDDAERKDPLLIDAIDPEK